MNAKWKIGILLIISSTYERLSVKMFFCECIIFGRRNNYDRRGYDASKRSDPQAAPGDIWTASAA
ncbi:MAG: hypothetical protein KAT62_03495, partial [Desulfuromonadales bacterium]|nr:hypothetical protein [Desulfuromonadales bacterium]